MADVVGLVVRATAGATVPGHYLDALIKALKEYGFDPKARLEDDPFVDDDKEFDPHIRVRGANGKVSNYKALADKLLDTDHAKIVVVADAAATTHMRKKTSSGNQMKVVSAVSFDPVGFEHIATEDDKKHPNKNVTGILVSTPTLNKERLEMLDKITKRSGERLQVRIVLTDGDPCSIKEAKEIEQAAPPLKIDTDRVTIAEVDSPGLSTFKTPLQTAATAGAEAFIVVRSPFFQYNRALLVAAANVVGRPAMYPFVDYVEDPIGGLISKGPDRVAGVEAAGRYVARLLNGAKVKDLAFMGPVGMITAISESTWSAQSARLKDGSKPLPYVAHP